MDLDEEEGTGHPGWRPKYWASAGRSDGFSDRREWFVMDSVQFVETSVMGWVTFVMSNVTESVKLMEPH